MYSLEVLSALLVFLSVKNVSNGDYVKALLYASLATSISYFNFTLLALLLFYALRDGYFSKKTILVLILGLLPYIAICIIRPDYYILLVDRAVNRAYTPLSIYRLISDFLGNVLAYRLSITVWLTFLVLIYALTPKTLGKLPGHIYTTILVLYTLHPYTYPQTLLLVLLAGLLTSGLQPERYYIVLEVFNAITLVLYLTSSNPLSLDNPAQWITQARNALLIIISLEALVNLYREK